MKAMVSRPASWSTCVPPCQAACPIHTDARGYVMLTSARKFDEAYRVARASNPLLAICGRACSAQCESACLRGDLDSPIAIRRIKRYLDESFSRRQPHQPQPGFATGRPVAIIGCGPAGLAAAHDLALLGHKVTIFDAARAPGGMAVLGVPRFRLPAAALERDVSLIRGLGVTIRTSTRVGRDIKFSQIKDEFEAVFVATGAFRPNRLEIPSSRLRGVFLPLPWLKRANLGERPDCGKVVVVIGGGYTAMDAARTAVRLGARPVSIFYRRTRQEMEVNDEELEETREEGVAIHFLASPVRLLSGDGRRVSATSSAPETRRGGAGPCRFLVVNTLSRPIQ